MPERRHEALGELFSAAVDDALTAEESARLHALLDSDPTARRELETYGRIKRLVRSASVPTGPEPDLRRLLAATLDTADAAPAPRTLPRLAAPPGRLVWRWAPAVTVAVSLFGLGVLTATHRDPPVVKPGVGVLSPSEGAWTLAPTVLAAHHARWIDNFRMTPMPAGGLVNITARLQEEVGYPVLEPDEAALGAKLYAGIADTGAGGSKRLTALLLLRRGDGAELSLFQIAAAATQVDVRDFTPANTSAVRTAEVDGTHLAYWNRDWLHVCLASNELTTEQLATMAPHAVIIDDRTRPR